MLHSFGRSTSHLNGYYF
jgi:hypothetical protein